MTAIAMEHKPAARPTERFVVVVFDGVSLGIMSFAFGVFDMAVHYGVLRISRYGWWPANPRRRSPEAG